MNAKAKHGRLQCWGNRVRVALSKLASVAPFRIAIRHHDVEYPLPAFFFGLNQAFQALASFATTLVFGGLSVLDLRLPWGWFGLCLAAVAGLAARREPNKTA